MGLLIPFPRGTMDLRDKPQNDEGGAGGGTLSICVIA